MNKNNYAIKLWFMELMMIIFFTMSTALFVLYYGDIKGHLLFALSFTIGFMFYIYLIEYIYYLNIEQKIGVATILHNTRLFNKKPRRT